IHSLTEGHGMPLTNCVTPANGDERVQVVPWLDAVKVHTGKRGRLRKRLKVIAMDKGYDAQALRQQLRKRGIRAQLPKRVWKTKKHQDRPIKTVVPRFQAECTFAWFQKKYAAWWSVGSTLLHALWRFLLWLRCTSGAIGS